MLASFVSCFHYISGFSQYKVFCLFHVSHTLFWHQLASSRYIKYSKPTEIKVGWGQLGYLIQILPYHKITLEETQIYIVTKH